MHPQLAEIDTIYFQVQDCLYPAYEYVLVMTEEQHRQNSQLSKQFETMYEAAREQLANLYPQLTPDQVVTGYNEGCRLLQCGLSGYMGQHFYPDYIPVMISAVKAPHYHTAWIFLQIFANQLGKDAAPLAIEALEKPGLRETALSVIGQLDIKEAIPHIQGFMQEFSESDRHYAVQVLIDLQK